MKGRRARRDPRGTPFAVITGSGLRDLFPLEEQRLVRTEFGPVTVYTCAAGGSRFLLLPRHGADHSIPPHHIDFKANLQALWASGARRVIATCAVGAISKKLRPGGMGLPDQFIDLSKRHLTFFDQRPAHTDMTHPYDLGLQKLILDAGAGLGMKLATGLVYVSVDGPRYETAAEIRMFGIMGGDVVGMTGAPEAILANELGMSYASIVVATNWAAGMQERVTHAEVEDVMSRSAPRVRNLIERTLETSKRIK